MVEIIPPVTPAPTATPPPSNRSKFPTERRELVLREALRQVREHGYEQTRLDTIADKTGTSKATLYRAWGGKAALVIEALHALSGIDVTMIDTGSLRGDLQALVTMLARHVEENTDIVLGLAHSVRRDPELRVAMDTWLSGQLGGLAEVTARAIDRGEIAPPDFTLLPRLLLGAILAGPVLADTYVTAAELQGFVDTIILPTLQATPAARASHPADRRSSDSAT